MRQETMEKRPPLSSNSATADEKRSILKDLNAYGIAAADNPQQAAERAGRWLWDTCKWCESSDDTDPVKNCLWCCEDFKPRKVKGPLVLTWLALQILGILFQFGLAQEVSGHLTAYEETLASYCGPEHQQHGVCLGPAWNLSYSGMLTFPPSAGDDSQADFDFIVPADQTFTFQSLSEPPTLLLGVEPQAPHTKARWKASIGAAIGYGGSFPAVYGSGEKYQVLSNKASGGPNGITWKGSLSLSSKFTDHTQIHLYVVDSRIKHLEEVHSQQQCSFEDSWQNFNARHSGQHHMVLTYAGRATSFFLVVSLLCTGVVLHRFYYFIEGGKLVSRIIAVKFLIQDFPQQVCIVAYFYGWYADNGLRCQMCLFHPQHCDDEYPLHFSNLMLCVFTLLSASSNQLLMQAKAKKYDEEEEFFLWFVRAAIFSVSVLPFSTAIVAMSRSLFHFRSVFIYFVAGVPMLMGWGTCLCVPMFTICDDDSLA